MGAAVDLLAGQLDEAFSMLRERVDGLTDQEFAWEPVPGSWTVRPGPDGRWSADYAEPDPVPAPFTTLGWRVVHVAECKLMYHEYAFGQASLTWSHLDSPHTAADAIAALERWQALLVADVRSVEDHALEALVPTNWGEEWPVWRIFWTMIHHDLWHGGEIGLLRDLLRLRLGR